MTAKVKIFQVNIKFYFWLFFVEWLSFCLNIFVRNTSKGLTWGVFLCLGFPVKRREKDHLRSLERGFRKLSEFLCLIQGGVIQLMGLKDKSFLQPHVQLYIQI